MSKNGTHSNSSRSGTSTRKTAQPDAVADELVEKAVTGKVTPERIAEYLNSSKHPVAAAREIVQALANRQSHATSMMHDVQVRSLEVLKVLAERAETDKARIQLANSVCNLAQYFSKHHVAVNRSNNNAFLKTLGIALLAIAGGAASGYTAMALQQRSNRQLPPPKS